MPKFKSLLVDSSDEDEPPEPNGSSLHKNLKKRKKVWEDSSDDEVDFPADRTVQLLQPSNILPSSGFCLNSDGGGSGWVCARGRGSSLRKKPIGKEKEEHIVSVELSEENDESDESVSGGKDVLEHQRRTGPCTNGSSIMESQYQYTRPESPQERNEVDRTSPTDIKSESCWLERRAPLSQSSCSLRLKLGRGEASLASCTALREGKTSHSQPIDSPDTSPLASYKPSAIPMPPPQYEQAAGLQSPPSNRLKTAIVTASKRRACNHDVWSTENLLHSDVYSEEDADGDSDSNIDSDETKFQDSSQTRCPVVPVAEWWVPPKELATTERQVETSSTGAISWPDEADGSPLPTEEWIMKGQRPDLYGWLESRGFVDSAPTALSAGSPPCTDKKLANACMTAAQEGRLSVLRWLSRLPNFDSLSLFRNNCSEFAPNQSIVFEAARNGHIEVLRWLARTLGGGDLTTHINKPSVDYGRGGAQGRKMLLQAVRERTWVSTNEGGGFFPLLMAAWNGHLPVVRWLFVHGATLSDVCFLGRTPIFYARTQGHFDVVRWLLLNGGASKCLRTRNDRSSDSPYVDDALVRSGFYEDIDSGGADDSAVVGPAGAICRGEIIKWARNTVRDYVNLRIFLVSVCHSNMEICQYGYTSSACESKSSVNSTWSSRRRRRGYSCSSSRPKTPWVGLRNSHAAKRLITSFLCDLSYFQGPALQILMAFVASIDRKLATDEHHITKASDETKVLIPLEHSKAKSAKRSLEQTSTSAEDPYLMEMAALGNCNVFVTGFGH